MGFVNVLWSDVQGDLRTLQRRRRHQFQEFPVFNPPLDIFMGNIADPFHRNILDSKAPIKQRVNN